MVRPSRVAPSLRSRPKAPPSRRSKDWLQLAHCTPCNLHTGTSMVCSAGSAPRGWCSLPSPSSLTILIPARNRSGTDWRGTSAAALAITTSCAPCKRPRSHWPRERPPNHCSVGIRRRRGSAMNPSEFAYQRAESIEEAIVLLQEHGEGAKLIAGGHSLLPIMKLRLAEPETLVDIGRIAELRGVRRADGEIAIGALSTHHQIATDAQIRSAVPLLADTAARVGDRQVRNRGTIGGTLAHADAAADYPAAILALDASIVARGSEGERRIPGREFFLDFLTTALRSDEILTEVRIAVPAEGHGWSYQKLANQASGYAIVGVGAMVVLDGEGRAADVRIGVTGAAAVPWRAEATETALQGQRLDEGAVAAAAELVDGGIDFLDDLHGSAEYRRRVTRGLTSRAIVEAAGRARQA